MWTRVPCYRNGAICPLTADSLTPIAEARPLLVDGQTVVAVGEVRLDSQAAAQDGQPRQWLRFKKRHKVTCFGFPGDLGTWVFASKAGR